MSNARIFLTVIVSLLAVAAAARAQDLVAFPTGNAAWAVDINASPTFKPVPVPTPGARILQVTHVEVTQVDKMKRVRLTWSDGKTSEKWNISSLPVTFNQDPVSGLVRPRRNEGALEAPTSGSPNYDQAAFVWVTSDCLQEKDPVSYQGKECFHYVSPPGSTGGNSAASARDKREAWIEAKTLLPVALLTQTETSTFTFADKPPTGTLTPPPAFAKEIAYYQAVMGLPITPAH